MTRPVPELIRSSRDMLDAISRRVAELAETTNSLELELVGLLSKLTASSRLLLDVVEEVVDAEATPSPSTPRPHGRGFARGRA